MADELRTIIMEREQYCSERMSASTAEEDINEAIFLRNQEWKHI